MENDLVKLNDQHMLMSEKERLGVSLITNALQQFDITQLNFNDVNVRDVAYLRGRMLDVEIADMLLILLSRLGPSVLAQFLSATRESQVDIYSNVLGALVNDRVQELGGTPIASAPHVSEQPPSTKSPVTDTDNVAANKSHLPELLTCAETMDYLKISRTKLFELRKSNALEDRRIGSSVRITRESVLRYLDLSG